MVVRTQDIITGVFRTEQAAHVSEETFRERTVRALPRRGDLLYSREGTYFGIAAEVPEKVRVCLGQRMVLIRPLASKLDFRFLRHWLNSPVMAAHIHGHRDGSVAERLNLPTIRALPIAVPPLPEQRAIAHILGTMDDKIELNRRANETLEAMARALFKAWFVDFEPVRAKLEGRWQRGQSLPGLPAHLYALFSDRLVESELGEIPEGWEYTRASQLIEFNPSEPLRKGTEAPYIEMAALPTSGSWPEPPVSRPFGSGMRFRNGDTLLARITPCLENGKTAFVQCLPDDAVGWGSTEYIVMRSKASVPPEFGYLLARDAAFREQAIRSMTGTSGRQRVQADSVAAFKIAAPSNEAVWDAFSRVVAPAFKSIKANAEAIATLAQLRDTLLPKLISGELRVPDAEAFLKERGL
ncbi:restriction endonuclease subunit S [Pseudothauera lacus]|uniref:restriction endonuclease subunit S n=1 Tax=Pseudothauera lacus TaxID=2136175 RepID=UPI0011B1EB54|nr:restriction endonuclease subunit S [Pseudothauera lacus]